MRNTFLLLNDAAPVFPGEGVKRPCLPWLEDFFIVPKFTENTSERGRERKREARLRKMDLARGRGKLQFARKC